MVLSDNDLRLLQDIVKEMDIGDIERLLNEDVVLHMPGRNLLSGVHRGKTAVMQVLSTAKECLTRNPYNLTPTALSAISKDVIIARSLRQALVNGSPVAWTRTDLYFLERGCIREWWVFANTAESFDTYWAKNTAD